MSAFTALAPSSKNQGLECYSNVKYLENMPGLFVWLLDNYF
jgi:hypothetical protein